MPTRTLSSIWMALVLAVCACDDPAPVVLARLQSRVRDAGSAPVDAGEREHEREPHERARDADENRDHDEPSERQ